MIGETVDAGHLYSQMLDPSRSALAKAAAEVEKLKEVENGNFNDCTEDWPDKQKEVEYTDGSRKCVLF